MGYDNYRTKFLMLFSGSAPAEVATYPYLFDTWSTKLEIKAIICEASDFWMVTIIAHTDHWYSRTLNQLYKFLHATSILISCHAINFIHYQNMVFCWLSSRSTLDIKV